MDFTTTKTTNKGNTYWKVKIPLPNLGKEVYISSVKHIGWCIFNSNFRVISNTGYKTKKEAIQGAVELNKSYLNTLIYQAECHIKALYAGEWLKEYIGNGDFIPTPEKKSVLTTIRCVGRDLFFNFGMMLALNNLNVSSLCSYDIHEIDDGNVNLSLFLDTVGNFKNILALAGESINQRDFSHHREILEVPFNNLPLYLDITEKSVKQVAFTEDNEKILRSAYFNEFDTWYENRTSNTQGFLFFVVTGFDDNKVTHVDAFYNDEVLVRDIECDENGNIDLESFLEENIPSWKSFSVCSHYHLNTNFPRFVEVY